MYTVDTPECIDHDRPTVHHGEKRHQTLTRPHARDIGGEYSRADWTEASPVPRSKHRRHDPPSMHAAPFTQSDSTVT